MESVAPAEPQSRALVRPVTRGAAPAAAADEVQSSRSAPEPPARLRPRPRDRAIARSVALELASPADRMPRLAERVTAVTNGFGGFVLSSSLGTGEDGAGGEFDLRIPPTACARRCGLSPASPPFAPSPSPAATSPGSA